MHVAWFQYFQMLSLLVAIYCYRGLRNCSLLAFIPYLIIVNITEVVGINFHLTAREGNYPVYNLYLLISTPVYFYIACKMLFLRGKETVVFYTICLLCLILVYLFGLITLVVLGLQEYILLNHIEIAHKTLYYVILPTLNAIVYSGYSYAFILCRTQRTR